MRFRFIQEHIGRYSVKRMCHALRVSRSGYYAWLKRGPSARELANQRLLVLIRAIYRAGRRRYGYRKVHQALLCQQVAAGRNRVARLMRQESLRSVRRRLYRVTTQSDHKRPLAPNRLAQRFEATAPNQTWLSDITFVRTAQGWLYLAAVLDLFSRRVVGWAIESHLTDGLTRKALHMALLNRSPSPGLLHHSDRGSQYASSKYQHLLEQAQAQVSMSRAGNAYDNAPMESFFATLKTELVQHRRYQSQKEATNDIFEYIEVFYNRQRLHQALGYRTPVDFESLFGTP